MRTIVAFACIIVFTVGFLLWYRWDSSANRGYHFGYYGEFNTVSNALSALPGVVITNSWHNADVTLEEFGFDLLWKGRELKIFFGARDPVRELSGADLQRALAKLI